jgi:hypothetical protein
MRLTGTGGAAIDKAAPVYSDAVSEYFGAPLDAEQFAAFTEIVAAILPANDPDSASHLGAQSGPRLRRSSKE